MRMNLGHSLVFDYEEAKSFAVPVREHSIIVTPEGFYPKQISLFAGEKLKLFVTSTLDKPSCFMMKGKDIFLPAKKGEIAEGSVYFKKPGKFRYYCPTGKISGVITVLERHSDKLKRSRGIASGKSRRRKWLPKEVPKGWVRLEYE